MTFLFMGLLLGVLFGMLLHQSQYNVSQGFQDIIFKKDFTFFYVLMIAISLESVVITLLDRSNIITIDNGSFSFLATALGSIIFGIGISVAYGCTISYIRAGEGYVDGIINLSVFLIVAGMTKYGALKPFAEFFKSFLIVDADISRSTGINALILSIFLLIVTAILVFYSFKQRDATNNNRKYHLYGTGIMIGVIAIIAWLLSEMSGNQNELEVAAPTANLMGYLITKDSHLIDWKVFFVIGILLGALLSSKIRHEFKWHHLSRISILNAVVGGVLMGFGAIMAEGCSIGNVLSATAALSWRGWTSMVFMMFGVWIVSYFKNITKKS